jgi:hypothetical protein
VVVVFVRAARSQYQDVTFSIDFFLGVNRAVFSPLLSCYAVFVYLFLRACVCFFFFFEAVARALKVRPSDIGVSGVKDKVAITHQWISVRDAAAATCGGGGGRSLLQRLQTALGHFPNSGGRQPSSSSAPPQTLSSSSAILTTAATPGAGRAIKALVIPMSAPSAAAGGANSSSASGNGSGNGSSSVGGNGNGGRVLLAFPAQRRGPLSVGQGHSGNRFTLTLRRIQRAEVTHVVTPEVTPVITQAAARAAATLAGNPHSSSSSCSSSSEGALALSDCEVGGGSSSSSSSSPSLQFQEAVESVKARGFVNFFGLQRVGEPTLLPRSSGVAAPPPLAPSVTAPPAALATASVAASAVTVTEGDTKSMQQGFRRRRRGRWVGAMGWMVGRALVRGDAAEAVDLLLGGCFVEDGEDRQQGGDQVVIDQVVTDDDDGVKEEEDTEQLDSRDEEGFDDELGSNLTAAASMRQVWRQTKDPKATLKALNSNGGSGGGDGGMLRERALLQSLMRFGHPAHALRALPRPVRTMWVHAFQVRLRRKKNVGACFSGEAEKEEACGCILFR